MKKTLVLSGVAALMLSVLPLSAVHAGAEGKCKACHDFGSANKMGPGLAGIFGKEAGKAEGFKYSDAMAKGGWVWDEANLRAFLEDSDTIKKLSGDDSAKSKMPSQRMKGDKLDEVIEFLKGLK